jgi:hypothetical protein
MSFLTVPFRLMVTNRWSAQGYVEREGLKSTTLSVVLSPPEGTDNLTPAQLKRELRRMGWGHARLAEKLGVFPTEVREWLAGKEPVPPVVASDIRNLPSAGVARAS